jgi:sporulation protein YlmC with PRC-barrel domain
MEDEMDRQPVAASDQTTQPLGGDPLIASDRVEGTAVYDTAGERIGTIRNFMVNKRSGRVAYAVLTFGGFLGFGENQYPLPWEALTYDTNLGGYVVDIDSDRLRDAPNYSMDRDPFLDPNFGRRVDEFWVL